MSGAERIGFVLFQGVLLDMADRLVAEVAGEAAAEAQRRRNRRDAMAREPGARTERVGLDAFEADVGAARVAQEAANRTAARRDPLMRSAHARPMKE